MRIVCINNDGLNPRSNTFKGPLGPLSKTLTLGKEYEGINISDAAHPYKSDKPRTDGFDTEVFVIDDTGNKNWYSHTLFKPLFQIREEKLNSLLQD